MTAKEVAELLAVPVSWVRGSTLTELCVHAAKHLLPEAAGAAEAFVFAGSGTKSGTT